MCWIMVKKPQNPVPFDFIDEAQKRNKDGYGVSWIKDGAISTFKTLDYPEFIAHIRTIQDCLMVVHLRYTSAGTTCADNIHPFPVPTGVMFHNGTISNLKTTVGTDSDTNILAQLITETKFEKISDIKPLLLAITGTSYNKLVFLNKDGTVDIINPELGITDENGNWYSNSYHIKEQTFNVFVYGTLKTGYSNSFYYMSDAEYIDDAKSLKKLAMVGKDMPFPYVLGESEHGHNIQGELYEVTASTLSRLDRLEGHPTHYNRKEMDFVTTDGEVIKALVYVKTHVTVTDMQKEFLEEWTKQPTANTTFKSKYYSYYEDQ